ncbi:MAG: DUF4398 domain-containing protein [Gammaproteobacteria bacterium]|nr:DUF4398 domain-containing protein [Gammaproteobacteria bacterium]
MRFSLPLSLWVAATVVTLSGCAAEGAPPQAELARARTLVEQADKAGAQRYAAADLERAHRELSDAENASEARKYTEARLEAESAAADADLAVARAADGEAERAAQQVVQANETLRAETEREAQGATGTPDSAPPPR